MYSNNYDESIPIQQWEFEAISNKKTKSESYSLTTCIVGNHNSSTIPFADSLQIIPSRKESLNRLDTEDFNKEVKLLAKGLSSFVNIKTGISREVYTAHVGFRLPDHFLCLVILCMTQASLIFLTQLFINKLFTLK